MVVAVDVGGGRFMVGRLLAVVVVVDRTWERFGFILGDAASAEPRRYLSYPFAYHTSTCGSTVKRVLYCYRKRSGVRIHEETNVFLHQIKLNWL